MMQSKKTRQPNDNKFRELILLISFHSEGDKWYGATKLNKLLFYIDFLAYLDLGEPITNHEYQRLDYGPAPRYLMPIREAMEDDGDIAIRKVDVYGREQHKIFALRPPELSEFTAEEVELVHYVINRFWDRNAKEISEESHTFVGWALADPGDTIPYGMALIGFRDLTEEEIEYGKTLEPLAREYMS